MPKSFLHSLLLGTVLVSGGAFAAHEHAHDAPAHDHGDAHGHGHDTAPQDAAPQDAAAPEAAGQAHDHAHGGQGQADEAKLHLNNGQRWPTDPDLRQGMANIRAAMAAKLPAIHKNKLSADDYTELAGKVESEIGGIIAKCKLEPEVDAQLHIVLSEMIRGIGRMRGGQDADERHEGAKFVVRAYHRYGQFFDDPGFRSLKH